MYVCCLTTQKVDDPNVYSVLIRSSTYAGLNFSKNPTKTNFFLHTHSTKRPLAVIMSSLRNPSQPDETPGPPKNGGMSISDISNDTPNQHYHNAM